MSRSVDLTPEAIEAGFETRGFICTGEVATTLYLSEALGKPVLLEGPPGVGKTESAKLWAAFHESDLVRLQCYEGLDEAKALYEWSYGKQMLYAQLLRDKTADVLAKAPDLGDGHLIVGQDLEEERLELLVGLIDLVDQQHHPPRGDDRAQQWTLQQILA